ncbi:uncharacterized protein LOC143028306 [Oratosquilla oratoria]|uniref:uncharacterized protein LOC143028306 n=1 Tax=Oratosquilla oratoria TaxID=337810 RepID=UPI003F75C64D
MDKTHKKHFPILFMTVALMASINAADPKDSDEMSSITELLERLVTAQQEKDAAIVDHLESLRIHGPEVDSLISRLDSLANETQVKYEFLLHRLHALERRVIAIEMRDLPSLLNQFNATLQGQLIYFNETLQDQFNQFNSTLGDCRPPFLRAGPDCLYLGKEGMTWPAARDYCKRLGGDLAIPYEKQHFQIHDFRPLNDPHPTLFDFLQNERKRRGDFYLWAWMGAAVERVGAATWQGYGGGDLIKQDDYPYGVLPGECIYVSVSIDKEYSIWSMPCSRVRLPLCGRRP